MHQLTKMKMVIGCLLGMFRGSKCLSLHRNSYIFMVSGWKIYMCECAHNRSASLGLQNVHIFLQEIENRERIRS